MLYFSSNVMELEINYTDCLNENNIKCADILNSSAGATVCNCIIPFNIDQVITFYCRLPFSLIK